MVLARAAARIGIPPHHESREGGSHSFVEHRKTETDPQGMGMLTYQEKPDDD